MRRPSTDGGVEGVNDRAAPRGTRSKVVALGARRARGQSLPGADLELATFLHRLLGDVTAGGRPLREVAELHLERGPLDTVESGTPPDLLVPALRRAVADAAPGVALATASSFDAHMQGPLSQPRLNAFLGLIENEQRSQSWVADVVRLRQLLREGVAMTLEDLKAYGFHAKTIKA